MAQTPPVWQDPKPPGKCPACHSPRVSEVKPDELDVWPLDPEDASGRHPAILQCRDCGAMVQWKPMPSLSGAPDYDPE